MMPPFCEKHSRYFIDRGRGLVCPNCSESAEIDALFDHAEASVFSAAKRAVERQYSLEIEVGFLWFSQMRETLESYAWNSPGFSWKEGNGIFDRTYYVKGPLADIQELRKRFAGWCSEIVEPQP